MAAMGVCYEVKRLYSSLQEMVGLRRRKRQLQISEPFDFKKEPTVIPGFTEDEISVLREKAAASRLGVADADIFFPFLLGSSPATSRLSIQMPMPIPPNAGMATSPRRLASPRSNSTASTSAATASATAHPVLVVRGSASMNDLDLLFFGGPAATGTGTAPAGIGMGMGKEPTTALLEPLSTVSSASSFISPLELDTASSSRGMERGLDWDAEFGFQLGSPVSPLSPSPGRWRRQGSG